MNLSVSLKVPLRPARGSAKLIPHCLLHQPLALAEGIVPRRAYEYYSILTRMNYNIS